jgi:hypothetical protein
MFSNCGKLKESYNVYDEESMVSLADRLHSAGVSPLTFVGQKLTVSKEAILRDYLLSDMF